MKIERVAPRMKLHCLTGAELLSLAFEDEVKLVRREFRTFASTLSPDFREILKEHSRERQVSTRGAPAFGEMATFLIADLMSVPTAVARELGLAWTLLYEYALLIDDLVDRTDGDRAGRLLLSQLLLNRAVGEYESLLAGQRLLPRSFLGHHREWLEGMAFELACSTKASMPPWDAAVKRQGEKAAIVKVAAAALTYRAENRDLTEDEVSGVDHLCRGVQLLDDLGDLWEDYRGRRLNGVLVRALDRARELGLEQSELDFQALLALALESGALSAAWATAARELESVAGDLNASEGAGTEALRAFVRSSDEYAVRAAEAARSLGGAASADGEAWETRKPLLAATAASLLARGPTACQ